MSSVVIDPDNLDRFQVIFGTEAQRISLYPVGLERSPLSSTGATTASSATFTDMNATFETDGVAPGDVICIQNTLDTGHYIVESVDSETQITVVLTDEFTGFVGSTGIVYSVREGEGGSIILGVTLQALYSYAKEEWRTDLAGFADDDLIRHPFPFEAITSEQFEIGGGDAHQDWTWFNEYTRKKVRTGGWADKIEDGSNIAEWAGIITLGQLDPDTQVYYQQIDINEDPANFEFLGPVNEAIPVFFPSDDRRQFLKLFARKKGRTYAGSEIADIGVTTIQTIVNRFPLAHTVDAAIAATDGEILGNAPFRNQFIVVPQQSVTLADVDDWTGTVTFTGATLLTSGVVAGDTVRIPTGTHEGYYTIISVDSETVVTVDTSEEGAFTATTADARITSTIRRANKTGGVALPLTDGVLANVNGLTGTLTSAGGGFTGVVVQGDLLIITEDLSPHKGVYKVLTVDSNTQLTVDTSDRPFTAQTGIDFRVHLPGMYLEYKESDITISATGDLTFSSNTLVRDTGSWITDGVSAGTVITVSGSEFNDGSYTVGSVTATTITLVMGETFAAEGPTTDPIVTAHDAFKRDIGGTIYAYRWRLLGNDASAANCYQFIQHQLRQPFDIDFSDVVHRGDVTDLLMSYAAPTGVGIDAYIQDLAAADINNMTFRDATGRNRQFPFLAAGQLNFNVNLVNDAAAKYWLFFTNDVAGDNAGRNFGTDQAILVEDANGNPIAGNVSGQATISFTYDYDGNTQRGVASAGTNAPVTLVAIGLTTAQYVIATGTIARSTANVISAVSALERNYISGL
jgi:hypothetical protein